MWGVCSKVMMSQSITIPSCTDREQYATYTNTYWRNLDIGWNWFRFYVCILWCFASRKRNVFFWTVGKQLLCLSAICIITKTKEEIQQQQWRFCGNGSYVGMCDNEEIAPNVYKHINKSISYTVESIDDEEAMLMTMMMMMMIIICVSLKRDV